MRFEKGDVVVCVDAADSWPFLVEGNLYIVAASQAGAVVLENGLSWFAYRFCRVGDVRPLPVLPPDLPAASPMQGSRTCPCGGVLTPVPTCERCGEQWLGAVEATTLDAVRAEREACARVCDEMQGGPLLAASKATANLLAAQIRQRNGRKPKRTFEED